MALNIKNEETCDLAKKLAGMTGESLTAVITDALREKVERLQQKQNKKAQAEELLMIGQRCASHIKEPASSLDHGDILYDKHGLPK
ncbi:MAG: type II toxin-antitoxin system VapB family antitoxin [Gammaproteobacteria bacterium]|nr:type II toxin-antitoxin system VapB family antitoxin [Gammaproteobacteria bacterium]